MEFGHQFRNFRRELGSFTCPKAGTWDRLFYFPSEGRHALDFSSRKNPTASVGSEPAILGTRGQHANFTVTVTASQLSAVLFQNGDSGLHAAALFGHVPVVRQLVSAGADPTLRNQDGATPLQLAQEARQTAVVEYLSRLVKGKPRQWL
jgi:hypothetical protein